MQDLDYLTFNVSVVSFSWSNLSLKLQKLQKLQKTDPHYYPVDIFTCVTVVNISLKVNLITDINNWVSTVDTPTKPFPLYKNIYEYA